MTHETEVLFRGAKWAVEFDYEGDGIIVWSFSDETVSLGADATEKERQEVYDQLWAYLLDWWQGGEEG